MYTSESKDDEKKRGRGEGGGEDEAAFSFHNDDFYRFCIQGPLFDGRRQ